MHILFEHARTRPVMEAEDFSWTLQNLHLFLELIFAIFFTDFMA